MTLKTLKDLQKELEWKLDTYVALRQEAIKWINKLQSDHPYVAEDPVLTMDQYIKGQVDWIKQFFNITEEDLK
jgi:hypothetical protein